MEVTEIILDGELMRKHSNSRKTRELVCEGGAVQSPSG